MALDEYRQKRDFAKTPEPAGAAGELGPPARSKTGSEGEPSQTSLLYIIQKHAARRLHYDFRLELDGVLLSWAVPKGPSLDPRDRRLATRVEDHPFEYGGFEGTIPAGEYGAGTVELWDRGTWQPEGDPHDGLVKGDLKFTLSGEKLRGSWVLVRMKPRPGREDREEWLLIKHRDEYAIDGDGGAVLDRLPRSVASGRTLEEIATQAEASVWHGDRPADEQSDAHPGEDFRVDPSLVKGAEPASALPRFVSPELAKSVERPPAGDQWLHEVKFDGYRIISRIENGVVGLYSRNGQDWTDKYPAVVKHLSRLPVESAFLDGEVVVQMSDGTTSFQALQDVEREAGAAGGAVHVDETDRIEAEGRLIYYLFDLPYLNGYDLRGAELKDRKELLRRLLSGGAGGGLVLFSDYVTGGGRGESLFEHACEFGLEGVVSKAAHVGYRPGTRSGDWQKTKCRREQEFVVGGYTEPATGRLGFGALLLGVYEMDGLRYVGKVGSGFGERTLSRIAEKLHAIEADSPPFFGDLPEELRSAHWVEPQLVVEVAFSEWTQTGRLRHPSFKGLREDKPPIDVTPDRPAAGDRPQPGTGSPSEPEAGNTSEPNAGDPPELEAEKEVTITHPERVFWPATGHTKEDLISYYERVADWMLPYVIGRPVAMLRCPDGVEIVSASSGRRRGQPGPCFFHKHPGPDFPGPFDRVTITESGGPAPYLAVTEAQSLTALAQMGVLEIHVWGSTWPDIEHPDVVVFDLDPDPALSWRALADGARLVRDTLGALGLESFVKTTGGKGLHVVAPLRPSETWKVVHDFAKAVAAIVAEDAPDRYTVNMSKAKRVGKIFIDYVRNNRGSTSVAPYSSRARERATVAVPLRWTELSGRIRPDTYTIDTLPARLRRLRGDPWERYFEVQKRQSVTPHLSEVVNSPSDAVDSAPASR